MRLSSELKGFQHRWPLLTVSASFHQWCYHLHFTLTTPDYIAVLFCKLTYAAYLNKLKAKSFSPDSSQTPAEQGDEHWINCLSHLQKQHWKSSETSFSFMRLFNELKTLRRHYKRSRHLIWPLQSAGTVPAQWFMGHNGLSTFNCQNLNVELKTRCCYIVESLRWSILLRTIGIFCYITSQFDDLTRF